MARTRGIAPARRRDVTARRDGPHGGRLIRRGDEQAILRNHADQMLIGRTKQITRQCRQRLWPRESRPPRQRDDAPRRIHGVQRAIRAQCGLPDRRADGVDATAAEVEREQFVLEGRDEEELRFGIESDHALDRGQAALEHPLDGREPR